MTLSSIKWNELIVLAQTLASPIKGPGNVLESDIKQIGITLDQLLISEDWGDVIKLSKIFREVITRDSISVLPDIKRLSENAIIAAEIIGDKYELAELLRLHAHNLHRQGYHQLSLEHYERSYMIYMEIEKPQLAIKSYFMEVLCLRALGQTKRAKNALLEVISSLDRSDPFLAEPLHIMGWFARDDGQLDECEKYLRQSINIALQNKSSNVLLNDTLADLAEVVGLQGRYKEAMQLFQESLGYLSVFEGQYDRQVARTKVKMAELEIRAGDFRSALGLLNQADDLISSYGGYIDLLWKLEIIRGVVFIHQKKYNSALRKFRVARELSKNIGLSLSQFLIPVLKRIRIGAGFRKVT